MRLCIYSTSFYPGIGGTEKATWLLACESFKAGHEVTIVTETPPRSWKNPEPSIAIVRQPGFKFLRKLYHRQDVLVINGGLSARAFLPAMFTGMKVIPLHAMITDGMRGNASLKDRMGDQVRRLLAIKADCHVGVSRFVLEAAGVEGMVIPNMIDPELMKWRELFRDTPKQFDLIYAGRLERSKGVHIILNQLARLKQSGTDVSLLICGEGSEKENLQNQVESHGITNKIRFELAESPKKLAELYSKSRAVIHTPLAKEGFGMTLIEGMAFGLPSVITNVPALPDTAGEAGWCMDTMSSEYLKPIIESIQKEDEHYLQKSREAELRAEQFTPEQTYQSWEEVFREAGETV